MDSSELFVDALRRLVETTPGGLTEVAERAGISEDNLKQVLAGTKLKSGRARGLGPNIRNRLDESFPDWWRGGRAVMTVDGVTAAVQTVGTMLIDLAGRLVGTDELTRQAMTPLIERLVAHPEEAAAIAPRVDALIAAEPHAPYATSPAAEKNREQQELRGAAARARADRPAVQAPARNPEPTTDNPKRPTKGH